MTTCKRHKLNESCRELNKEYKKSKNKKNTHSFSSRQSLANSNFYVRRKRETFKTLGVKVALPVMTMYLNVLNKTVFSNQKTLVSLRNQGKSQVPASSLVGVGMDYEDKKKFR